MIYFRKIKILCIDLDGVLTDGTYQVLVNKTFDECRVSELGPLPEEDWIHKFSVIGKSFYTRDFYAIEQWLKNEGIIIIVTQSTSECIKFKLEEIKKKTRSPVWLKAFEDEKIILLQAADNKEEIIEKVKIFTCDYNWNNVAYMGDAENDLECMKKAYYTGCPIDAIPVIKENSNYISDHAGGRGCVYDFIEYILKKKGKENENLKS